MIKVNLLDKKSSRARRAPIRTRVSITGLASVAIFIVLAGGLGGYWYHLGKQIDDLTANRDRLRIEFQRLQDLNKQIKEFEKLKQDRESRIRIIETLKENQTGPVLLLNHVLASIPAGSVLWLTSMDQKGDKVRISGFTQRGETIPDFMSNLSRTGFFKTVDLELYEDRQKDAAKFTLVCISEHKSLTE